MAYANFKPLVWSKHIQHELEKFCVLAEDCDYRFEGEAKRGNQIKILGVSRPTIGDYAGNDIGAPEDIADSSQYLMIDQAKYFNFKVDDVDKAQSVDGLMAALMEESTRALAEKRDTFIATLAAGAGSFSTSLQITTSAAAKAAVDTAFVTLWNSGVSLKDEVIITITLWFYSLFKNSLTEMLTDNVNLVKKGIVGLYNGASVKMSNNLYNDGTDDYMMIRTKKAIAFAGQIDETEAYRPEGLFADAVKGLDVYGGKVVRPKEIYVIKGRK